MLWLKEDVAGHPQGKGRDTKTMASTCSGIYLLYVWVHYNRVIMKVKNLKRLELIMPGC